MGQVGRDGVWGRAGRGGFGGRGYAAQDQDRAQAGALTADDVGVQAVADYAKTGKKPEPSPGLKFFNTGVKLITDKPVKGVESISADEGLKLCWG